MEISENRFTGLFKRAFISLSIIIFFISFNIKDTPPPFGWYQQFLPTPLGGSIKDIYFVDSLLGFAVSDSCIFKTTNGGDNWNIKFYSSFFTRIKFLNNNTGFASDAFNLHKTTNSGENWSTISFPGDLMAMDMSVLNEDTIWICNTVSLTGGVFRTTNGGLNWTQQYSNGTENPNKIYMFNARIGFICNTANASGIKRTTNGGVNWSMVTPNEGFKDLYFADSLTGWRANDYIKKTTDGGLTWVQQQLPQGIPGHNIVWGIRSISKISRDTIWGCYPTVVFPNLRYKGILYRTTNGGTNWYYQIPDTAFNIPVYSFINFINNKTGWAYNIVASGIHTINSGDTTFFYTGIIQKSTKIPNQFVLKQNYPNPFNPRTVIGYELKKAGDIKIKVYSITGSEVFTLVNQRQTAGVYEVDMPGIGLSSGVYFYSLFVDNKRVDSKSMVLIK